MSGIVVRGAREHNLQNICVEIPWGRLVVVTGPSGSGKSSLAFDTIYAEGRRRYVESLSAYARQILGAGHKPNVESITGLSPAIAIEQRTGGHNPRSTVGTLTEVNDYLRIMFARLGKPHCPQCGKAVAAQTLQQMVDTIMTWPERTRFVLLAPFVEGDAQTIHSAVQTLRQQGFARVRLDGHIAELTDMAPPSDPGPHTLDVVVDRLILKPERKQRLTDSLELALRTSDGVAKVAVVGGQEHVFSERYACDVCDVALPPLEPQLFSFNTPQGACSACQGLGYTTEWDIDAIVPDPRLSLQEGALAPWTSSTGEPTRRLSDVAALARARNLSLTTPWSELPAAFRELVLQGSHGSPVAFAFPTDAGDHHFERPYEGLLPQLSRRFGESSSERVRDELAQFATRRICAACDGMRLRPEALAVTLAGHSIAEVSAMAIPRARAWAERIGQRTGPEHTIAGPLVREVTQRLAFLESVGLDYLSLARASSTLSGGEAQRIRLATQIGSALRGVIYVLDEPSIGLHPRDNAKLLAALERLRDQGNTVLVVEHDAETMRAADYLIDMGPGAGTQGGYIVAQGAPEDICRNPNSSTGQFLTGARRIEAPAQQRTPRGWLSIRDACGHNLQHIDVSLPLGAFVCVTGVSGSGKSTLVHDTLYKALARRLHGSKEAPEPFAALEGVESIEKVAAIDQSPIGRTPRSNPATYTGILTPLRELFAGLPESRARGYGPGRFSFNVKGGRCEACEGEGLVRVEMHLLPDVYVPCAQCGGQRYNRETLEIRYKGYSIADVLAMTVDEAHGLLNAVPSLRQRLETLRSVGLGYIQLGQSATTLSGGEAQRIKLARELARTRSGHTLYILDEPTTGLHFSDVQTLMDALADLVDAGNSLVVIEHDLDVVKAADYVIDLGPEGGSGGGAVVATGAPAEVAQASSHTGYYLRSALAASAERGAASPNRSEPGWDGGRRA